MYCPDLPEESAAPGALADSLRRLPEECPDTRASIRNRLRAMFRSRSPAGRAQFLSEVMDVLGRDSEEASLWREQEPIVLESVGRLDEAERRWRELLASADRSADPSLLRLYLNATRHWDFAKFLARTLSPAADAQHRRAAALMEEATAVDRAIDLLCALAEMHREQGNFDAAESAYLESVAVVRRARCTSAAVRQELLKYAVFLRERARPDEARSFEGEIEAMSHLGWQSTCARERIARMVRLYP